MKDLIQDFPNQIDKALQIARETPLRNLGKRPSNVLITGLGGSGIGGTIVSDLCAQFARVPIAVNKDYGVPHWVGADTLVIACSYSGNTEETLEACSQALEYGAMLAAITSGGKLKELCVERGLNHIIIPGGNPPRSMLGYSLVQIFKLLSHYGIQTPNFEADLEVAVEELRASQDDIKLSAKDYAEALKGKLIAIYSCAPYGGVTTRWRQQFNENSKMLGWDSVIPEMNHNQLVGWAGGSDQIAAIILRSEDEHPNNARRADLNAALFKEYTSTVLEIHASGANTISRVFNLIHLGDWISYYLSEINQVDIMDIHVIEDLKSKLQAAVE